MYGALFPARHARRRTVLPCAALQPKKAAPAPQACISGRHKSRAAVAASRPLSGTGAPGGTSVAYRIIRHTLYAWRTAAGPPMAVLWPVRPLLPRKSLRHAPACVSVTAGPRAAAFSAIAASSAGGLSHSRPGICTPNHTAAQHRPSRLAGTALQQNKKTGEGKALSKGCCLPP